MKAAQINEWGQPIQITELSQPSPADDEVLVQVRASSVNPIDRIIAAGYMKEMYSTPITLGTDLAGIVVSVGKDVAHVKPGDEVYGASLSRGAFAEYVTVKAIGVAHKPRSVDMKQAAAIPLTGLTAWQTLFNLAQLQQGERILIHGAGGGIGSLAIQLAKNKGAYVIAHELPTRADLVKELGADEYINAGEQQFENVAGKVDVVLDLVGGEVAERSFKVLPSGGRLVTTIAQLPDGAGKEQGIKVLSAFTQPTVEELNELTRLFDSGVLKVFVHNTFPLEDAQEALYYMPKDGAPGKTVITVN